MGKYFHKLHNYYAVLEITVGHWPTSKILTLNFLPCITIVLRGFVIREIFN